MMMHWFSSKKKFRQFALNTVKKELKAVKEKA
jgi:hypothetical protein